MQTSSYSHRHVPAYSGYKDNDTYVFNYRNIVLVAYWSLLLFALMKPFVNDTEILIKFICGGIGFLTLNCGIHYMGISRINNKLFIYS